MNDVKTVRKALGLTQKALAERLGVSVIAVKWWEGGQRAPSAENQDRLLTLMQGAQAVAKGARQVASAAAPVPTVTAVAAPPPVPGNREVIRLGEAVRRMGLQDGSQGRRSDRTIRNAIKSGRLPAWKAPGYRAAIAEWCFYADDFETWRRLHYHAHRDPRRQQP